MNRKLLYLIAALPLMLGGCFLRTDYVLSSLNKPSDEKPEEAPVVPVADRVARLARAQLVDSYVEPQTAAKWMSALGASPEVIIDHAACLAEAAGGDNSRCYEAFSTRAIVAQLWGMPAAPESISPGKPPAAEVDAARFLGNALGIAPSLVTLETALGRRLTPDELRTGIQAGAEAAAQYVHARRWHRTLGHPATAIVMSGGAANGAFSAGLIWRLLGILEECRGKPAPEGCGDARVDLVAGTSTGTLIGTLVDLFHTAGQEKKAREMLMNSYTCSVESDLYCVNSTWIWKLNDDLPGLVRFDGIDRKLREAVSPAMMANNTELVAVSVDYNSGDVFSISDQDPSDIPVGASNRVDGLINGIMASIVEPVLAEPVKTVPATAGQRAGTFLDGGVRSGLPLLQAVQRGAERVLVISTGGIDPDPSPESKSKNAFGILMRTLDLFVAQPRVGEVQQSEFMAVARRMAEYNVCKDRLVGVKGTEDFCRRAGEGFEPPMEVSVRAEAQTSMWMGPAHFPEVASSWRSALVFRPSEDQAASGYAFNPQVMRPLFSRGVKTFQDRCKEMLQLFGITGAIAQGECTKPAEDVIKEAESRFIELNQCTKDKPEQRKCE